MPKTIEHIHWPDAPDLWMPYAPAIKVKGGTTVYLAGVTAAPVYHHHPHRPEEFDAMPRDMAGQARAALENLKRGLDAVGATFADIVTADRFVTDLTDQDALNRVWGEYFGDAKPTTTTVQVVRLADRPALPRRDQRHCRGRLSERWSLLPTGLTPCRSPPISAEPSFQPEVRMADLAYRTALIVGVGGGLSASVARTFAKAGMKVALAARRRRRISRRSRKEIGGKAFACDATRHAEVVKLFADVEAALGAPDVSSTMRATARAARSSNSIRPRSRRSLTVTAFGGFLVAQEAVKRMLPHKHGAILFTGASASVKGYAQSAPFAMGKFALRGLAQSMARELSPQGIHVAHVVIDGGIRSASRARAAGQARQHARSRRHRADLSGSAAAAAQRLGLGDRTAAVGGAVLKLARRPGYSRSHGGRVRENGDRGCLPWCQSRSARRRRRRAQRRDARAAPEASGRCRAGRQARQRRDGARCV